MPEVINDSIVLHIGEDGLGVTIVDRRRGCEWAREAGFPALRRTPDSESVPLPPGTAVQRGNQIRVTYPMDGGKVEYLWEMHADHVSLTVTSDSDAVETLSLPGPFALQGDPQEVAVPVYQGVLIRGSGSTWRRTVEHGGHSSFSMSMAATLSERGSLLLAHESPANWTATYGEEDGRPFVFFEHRRCPVDGWSGATIQICPCDSGLTAVCKRYRSIVKEGGDLVTWEKRVAAKPILADLFGSLIAFTGYNRCDEMDYAACARALRAYGFERVLYYPVRMCHYSLGFRMGGDDPVWLSDGQLGALKQVEGARLGPWAWVYEGLDDGTDAMRSKFRCNESGPVANWRMDQNQWYSVCTPYQIEHMKARLAGDMAEMDWLHFDVNASIAPRPCRSARHALHGNRPLGALGDTRFTRELFSKETVGNRIVSSEGFSDYYAAVYDIGSTKIVPPDPPNGCMPVPMTMLVFHDSCVHDWWELHNYNPNPGFPMRDAPNGIGRAGSGEPALKAAIDALYGCPPNVFPFGRQYGWVTAPGGDTYSFTMRLKDESSQEALRAALPVARLHRRIGRCEMVSSDFLSDDRTVQATTFSDGTRIVANLGTESREVEGSPTLPPHSWLGIRS